MTEMEKKSKIKNLKEKDFPEILKTSMRDQVKTDMENYKNTRHRFKKQHVDIKKRQSRGDLSLYF